MASVPRVLPARTVMKKRIRLLARLATIARVLSRTTDVLYAALLRHRKALGLVWLVGAASVVSLRMIALEEPAFPPLRSLQLLPIAVPAFAIVGGPAIGLLLPRLRRRFLLVLAFAPMLVLS